MSGEVQVLVSYSSTFVGFFLSGTGGCWFHLLMVWPVPLVMWMYNAENWSDVWIDVDQHPLQFATRPGITMYHLIEPCTSLVGSTYSIVYEKSALVIFLWILDCPFGAKVNWYGEQGCLENVFFKKKILEHTYILVYECKIHIRRIWTQTLFINFIFRQHYSFILGHHLGFRVTKWRIHNFLFKS